MKFFLNTGAIAVLLWGALPGCGKTPDDPLIPVPVEAHKTIVSSPELSHTESYDEDWIHQKAAKIILSGGSLSSELAENCWKIEAARASIREACVLAWATGNEPSPLLEEMLRLKSSTTRNLALATVRRKKILASLNFGQLLATLQPLVKDPSWVKALAMEEWLKSNDAPASVLDSREVWSALDLDPRSASLDPASTSLAYKIARKLNVMREEELLTTFCAPSAGSFAQVRCWRFLSSLVDPFTGQGLDVIARTFLPRNREDGWILFERSFPERAILLQQYR